MHTQACVQCTLCCLPTHSTTHQQLSPLSLQFRYLHVLGSDWCGVGPTCGGAPAPCKEDTVTAAPPHQPKGTLLQSPRPFIPSSSLDFLGTRRGSILAAVLMRREFGRNVSAKCPNCLPSLAIIGISGSHLHVETVEIPPLPHVTDLTSHSCLLTVTTW